MCGIAGYIAHPQQSADSGILKKMAAVMALRGPDGEGIYIDGAVGFAHRRLSVIDLANGAQPMGNKEGSAVLVFNGEIFNFKELRKELEEKNYSFTTHSDTEVLLAIYEVYGIAGISRLNGFFAFALYDRNRQKLFFGRDRLGIKPLYWGVREQCFAFSSELSAFKILPAFCNESPDPAMVAHYFCYQYVDPVKSIYPHIHKFPPGCWGELDLKEPDRNLKIQQYWQADYTRKTALSYDEACGHLRKLMHHAVACRMIADVPLGVSLSGGMDSAIVAGIAAELSRKPLQCFSIGFPVQKYDERKEAMETAAYLRRFSPHLEHHIKVVDPSDFDLLPFLAERFGEPYGDASMLPSLLLSRFSREFVTVSLSGDGADELFAGYERYRAMDLMNQIRWIPGKLLRTGAACIPPGGERSWQGRFKRFLNCAAEKDPDCQYTGIVTHQGAETLSQIASPLLKDALKNLSLSCRYHHTAENFIERFMERDLQQYLPGDILVKTDVCSMAASLELRSPFLDYQVVEFANSLPLTWKLLGKNRKRILKDAFSAYFPADLKKRKKKGFGVPLAHWFRSCWKEPLREHLLEAALADGVWVERRKVETMIQEHLAEKADHSVMLFSLLMFDLFLERYAGE